MRIIFGCLFTILMTIFGAHEVRAEIAVVASIKPIHSLVATVMAGVSTPELLMDGNATPHSFAFKPSDVRKVTNADIVFYVGPELETSLIKLLAGLPVESVQSIIDWSGVNILKTREGGIFTENDETSHRSEKSDSHQHSHGERDPHVWLNPDNAVAIVLGIVRELSRLDPENAGLYRLNGENTIKRIETMKREIQQQLSPVRQRPFIVFHDAFHYFEDAFGLNNLGAVSINPDKQPGAKRIYTLRKLIEKQAVVAVFVEPQFSRKLSQSLVDGTSVRLETIDPLGATVLADQDAYFEIMQQLSGNIAKGLAVK